MLPVSCEWTVHTDEVIGWQVLPVVVRVAEHDVLALLVIFAPSIEKHGKGEDNDE